MGDYSWGHIIFVIMLVVAVTLVLKALFEMLANNYIKKKREQLFTDTEEVSKRCKEMGKQILENKTLFYDYINEMGLNQEHKCSNQIVSNAANNKVKYLIKYSNIENDIYYLERLDFCIGFLEKVNDFSNNINLLYKDIKKMVPFWVKVFASANKAPYTVCGIDSKIKIVTPTFLFIYKSPSGKSQKKCEIKITYNVLKKIQAEIAAKLNKSGHAKSQRSSMTNDLRAAIKQRDNYTCCLCGNSVYDEPNLLLEVDHIVPISKGGKTEASNLQTLCWRCNREKSNR